MSDSRSRWADDENEYERLCEYYGVKPELEMTTIGLMTSCYGEQAQLLEESYKKTSIYTRF